MSTEIILAVVAIAATPVSGWIGAKLMRQKYRVEIASLRADLDSKLTETRSTELDNVRQGNDILMSQIVGPLKGEIKSLRSDVNKFRKAIEKISGCAHATECPVSRELLANEKNDFDSSEPRKKFRSKTYDGPDNLDGQYGQSDENHIQSDCPELDNPERTISQPGAAYHRKGVRHR